jgi:hypothetical protein
MEIRKSAKSFLTGLGDGLSTMYNPFQSGSELWWVCRELSIMYNPFTYKPVRCEPAQSPIYGGNIRSYDTGLEIGLGSILIPVFGAVVYPPLAIGLLPLEYKALRWICTKH